MQNIIGIRKKKSMRLVQSDKIKAYIVFMFFTTIHKNDK